mmetsp:Transcript_12307/g.18776  ORF Transcript_12307/g.18776 Transcript_12307/m.18776 type:complete len:101 (+) Transcript_12307:611-913(+)
MELGADHERRKHCQVRCRDEDIFFCGRGTAHQKAQEHPRFSNHLQLFGGLHKRHLTWYLDGSIFGKVMEFTSPDTRTKRPSNNCDATASAIFGFPSAKKG